MAIAILDTSYKIPDILSRCFKKKTSISNFCTNTYGIFCLQSPSFCSEQYSPYCFEFKVFNTYNVWAFCNFLSSAYALFFIKDGKNHQQTAYLQSE